MKKRTVTKQPAKAKPGVRIQSVELLRPRAGDTVTIGVAVGAIPPGAERERQLARVEAFFRQGLPEDVKIVVYNSGDLTVKVVRPS